MKAKSNLFVSRYARNHGTRSSQIEYLKSKGWLVIQYKRVPAVVAVDSRKAPLFYAKGWLGNADKPSFYYGFRTEERCRQYVESFVANAKAHYQHKAEQAAKAKEKRGALNASDYWAVGDVIYNSWGYDQTNIDFYQVIEVKEKSIVVREIAQNSSDHGGPHGGMCQPRRAVFCGQPMVKHLNQNGGVRFEFGGASKWDGRPLGCSSYH